ncbi:MAG: ATP-binding protein [bacterium]
MSAEHVSVVLEDLIRQFADPHAFFRELIQNAVDAGSNEVEIEFDYDQESQTLTIHINDFGEGMTREIIETRLTRLFSSTKDDDLTKIGRFGIGFVSVYAIEPDAIAVDTARGGECWRVLFKPDRTFELYTLSDPVEGTRIRVFKRMTRTDADTFVSKAHTVIQKWCAHVAVPIYVSGKDIRKPFEVDAPIVTRFNEEGTRVVAGLVAQSDAFYGYYNRGLTLFEGTESQWPGMTFRMDSRYLEHTLTRDRVLEDKNFHKAQDILDRLYTQTLPDLLVAELEQQAAEPPTLMYAHRMAAMSAYLSHNPTTLRKFEDRKIFIAGDGPGSMRDLAKRPEVFVSAGADHLLALASTLVGGAEASSLLKVLRLGGVTAKMVEGTFVMPSQLRPVPVDFADAVVALARKIGFALETVFIGNFSYPFSPIEKHRFFFLRRHENSVTPKIALDRKDAHPGSFESIIINQRDEFANDVISASERDPQLAAMVFMKSLWLPAGMSLDEEDRVLRAAIQIAE